MLEDPNSNLHMLNLHDNNIGDEWALGFANALANNRKLKTLDLSGRNGITAQGWSSFSKALCDTSSVNHTFLSNHTLEDLGVSRGVPAYVASLLELNESNENKNQIAIKKILKHHQHFNMEPFFEWELKVLPIAINWFERAQSIENNEEVGVGRHKLGAIYQFIRAMPEVFEPGPGSGGKRKRNAVDGHA